MRVQVCAIVAAVCWCGAFAAEDPLTLTAAKDTTLQPGITGAAPKYCGMAEDLMIYGPAHANPNFRALIQFDLKDVPKTPVRAAVLKLTFYKMYSAAKTRQDILRVHRLVRPWEETAASWTNSFSNDEWINKGGDFDPVPIGGTYIFDEQTGDDAGKTVEFDVTGLVQAWQMDRMPNYGFILLNTDNDSKTTARPFSRDCKDDAKRPKLILYWAAPPKPDNNWLKPAVMKPFGLMPQMKVEFNTPTLNQARIGENYKAFLSAKGGLAPYAFKLAGDAPDGIKLNPSGLLEGLPTKAGRFTLNVTITDDAKHSGSGKVDLVVAESAGKTSVAAKTAEAKSGEAKTGAKKSGVIDDE
ncbi:MAG: DNRLRE domain-containing protein [Planctomycetes bacterium]|nr:DNRLRE domain-containing protein [Planctomycetota bacterium]